jgi:hypothetical protein
MRALDQFSKFCAMIASGLATTRPTPDRERKTGGSNDAPAPPRGQPAAQPAGRDDDRPRPPRVSHPAAWPR